MVGVKVEVGVWVFVGVRVGVLVMVGVKVEVGVWVFVGVRVGVSVMVGVKVEVGVLVLVDLLVLVGVGVTELGVLVTKGIGQTSVWLGVTV